MTKLTNIIAVLWVGAALAGPPPGPSPAAMPQNGKMTVQVAPPFSHDERVTLQVTVGALPKGAQVVIRSDRGEVIGTVSPFGAAAARGGGTYAIPVPAEIAAQRKMTLNVTVEEERGKKVRAPTNEEVTAVKLQTTR